MMKVEAWQDELGNLYGKRSDAVEADFIAMVRSAWGSFPADGNKGDARTIARLLASDIYPAGRKKLLDALLWFEENRGDNSRPA